MTNCIKMCDNNKSFKPLFGETFKLFNNIDKFKDFQNDILNNLSDLKKLCVITSSGNGKTTIIKYLAFDFLDFNLNNKILIIVNTRVLSLDIEKSMLDILQGNDKKYICNLCKYSIENPISNDIINSAKVFISTPAKYLNLSNKIGKSFAFVSIDEIDILLDNKLSIEDSDILKVLQKINFDYSLISTATINDNVYKYIVEKYEYYEKTFIDAGPNIRYFKLQFNRKEKDWYKIICDKIYYILESKCFNKKSIVFCNFKDECEKLYHEYSASLKEKFYFHGNFSTNELDSILHDFKESGVILFTTDMAQRGLNITDVENIFHIGVTNKENFYHRVGRMGRLRKQDVISDCYIFYDLSTATNQILVDVEELKLD